ncbi:Lrp/AsnC family transcription regulator [Haloferax elongans ATCC BAA-1513]|uniref:Lrp/AsnC family transcription regulator n=1 Tax=Haloferax elongans ATCC BAA-1513 TaxID=1230453 RepID=M0HQ87_HALEO|nr:Lrp/AsnC family transcriptional regulator [Haloferax elongans]ELZ85877.1 Lrp/AsnC family transcription regulator [Haloferax elongans ATCC BAA-1513]
MDKRSLLDLLRRDARESVDDIARQLGADAEAVAAALEELEADGVVRGYQAVVDWDRVSDEHVRAQVEVDVELDRETGYEEIATRIARFPEVATLRLVSGDYDFFIEVEGESMHDVSNFVSERIAPIPEVTKTVTHFVMDSYKEEGIELGDGDDDDRLSVSP